MSMILEDKLLIPVEQFELSQFWAIQFTRKNGNIIYGCVWFASTNEDFISLFRSKKEAELARSTFRFHPDAKLGPVISLTYGEVENYIRKSWEDDEHEPLWGYALFHSMTDYEIVYVTSSKSISN